MQAATSETKSKSLDLSICGHHYTLRAPCPKGQGISSVSRWGHIARTNRFSSVAAIGSRPAQRTADDSRLVVRYVLGFNGLRRGVSNIC